MTWSVSGMAIKVIKKEVDRKKGDKGERWSRKQKYEAVSLYMLTGSVTQVSQMLGIPLDTLKEWKFRSDWWSDFEEDIRLSKRANTNKKLSKIADKSVEVLMDRLENGDFVYNQKTGELSRKPVNAHVANRVYNDSIDKQVLLEKLYQGEKKVTKEEEIKERLERLHDEFSRFAKLNKPKTIEAKDIEYEISNHNPDSGDGTI